MNHTRYKRIMVAAGVVTGLVAAALGIDSEEPKPVATSSDTVPKTPIEMYSPQSMLKPTPAITVTAPPKLITRIVTKVVRVPGPTKTVTKTKVVQGPVRYITKTRTITKYVSRAAKRVAAPIVARSTFSRSGTSQQRLVSFGRLLESRGFSVSEHPTFGGVTPGAHSVGSTHYYGNAIDVNKDNGMETSEINAIVGTAREFGLRTIWQYPGHYDHAHFDTKDGPDL